MARSRAGIIAMVVAAVAAIVLAGGSVFADGPGRDDDTPITGPALDRASTAALDYTGPGRVTETEVGDEEGYYEVEVVLNDGRQVDVHLDENFNVLSQEAEDRERGDDKADVAITGDPLARASAAALASVGGGCVTDTEVDDGGSYEVEVALDNGRQVEVHLDMNFNVISQEADDD